MRIYFYVLLFFISSSTLIHAQLVFSDTTKNPVRLKENASQVKTMFTERLKKISPRYQNKETLKLAKTTYDEQYKMLDELFQEGNILEDKDYQSFIESIAKHIIQKNPLLANRSFKFYVSRSNEVNAFNLGDGVIVVYLGLLQKIPSEDALAVVLAHEMAHDYLQHFDNEVYKKSSYETSDEMKATVKTIKKIKYNRSQAAMNVFKDALYQDRKSSREMEMQADSLGYIFLKPTKYKPTEVITALNVLDLSEKEPDSLVVDDYKVWLTTPEQAFNPAWFNIEDHSDYQYSDYNVYNIHKDSIRTHPDIDLRISHMRQNFNELKDVQPSGTTSSLSVNNKKITNDYLMGLFYYKEYGLCLYESLKILKKDPTNPAALYFRKLSFEKLIEAKRTKTLGKYIDFIDHKEDTKSFQRFASFMRNIDLSEMQIIYKHLSK